MLSVALTRHPSTPCEAVSEIIVDLARTPDGVLTFAYSLTGDIDHLRIPARRAPARANELWRQTCFEAFVQRTHGAYLEFNFAPSTEWAAYRFSGYRENMSTLEDIQPPMIAVCTEPFRFDLEATLELTALPQDTAALRFALSTVIEEQSGQLSYWAATHPPGKPDFHHADSFSIVLA
jgi:hypothetical protein